MQKKTLAVEGFKNCVRKFCEEGAVLEYCPLFANSSKVH